MLKKWYFRAFCRTDFNLFSLPQWRSLAAWTWCAAYKTFWAVYLWINKTSIDSNVNKKTNRSEQNINLQQQIDRHAVQTMGGWMCKMENGDLQNAMDFDEELAV